MAGKNGNGMYPYSLEELLGLMNTLAPGAIEHELKDFYDFGENGFCCNGAWYVVEEVKGLNGCGAYLFTIQEAELQNGDRCKFKAKDTPSHELRVDAPHHIIDIADGELTIFDKFDPTRGYNPFLGGVSVNLLDKTNRLRGIARLDLEEGLKAYLIIFARYQDIKYGVLP